MKYFSRILLLTVVISMLITACSKVDNLNKPDDLPLYVTGVSPTLTSSLATVAPALADTAKPVITFSWTNPKYATDSATVKYVLEIDSTNGNFANVPSKTVTGVFSTTLTGRELNAILIEFGYPLGVAKKIKVRVISSYANNNDRYTSNNVEITVTPFADGAKLIGTATSVETSLANAAVKALDFTWSRPFPGFMGAVSYVLEYDSAGKSFATPKVLELDPLTPNFRTLTQSQLNEAVINVGVVGGTTGQVSFRIKSTTALGAVVYSNLFLVTVKSYFPIRRFYMPGGYQESTGNGNPWDPETAPEFIRDLRPGLLNDIYYMYIYLPAYEGFKITQGRSWAISYGGSGGNLSASGSDILVSEPGFYRISINIATMKYDISEGRMGFVGGATGAGWNPPNVFPNYAMGNAGTNLFVGITDLSVDGWKLIDNNQWNNGSNAVDETRGYGTSAASGGTLQINGDNFSNVAAAGRYRVIWDGRDRDNVKYERTPATEMRVVGNGMSGVSEWNPGASPQMAYQGNGVWTITLSLIAGKEIKFLSGNDWGAFDYEDNSGGSNAVGTERKIKWENGDNFKTPATAGSYTIRLDENNQTVSFIN